MKKTLVLLPLAGLLGACVTRFGENDTQGVTVRTGHNVLVRTVPVPPDATCPNGGSRVLAGQDQDADGALADREVTSADVVCAGAPGPAGAAGDGGSPGRDGVPAVGACAGGQRLAFNVDGGAWVCAQDADGLRGLTCAPNARATWNGQRWDCVTDGAGGETLLGLNCTPGVAGQLARFDGVQWRCGIEPDSDQLGSLRCTTAGEVLTWNGASWTCGVPVDADGLRSLTCAAGQMLRWNGAAWQCVADAVALPGVDLLRSLHCVPNQVAKFNGVAWACATDNNTMPAPCGDGQLPKWEFGGWTCGADADTDTLAALGCAPGELPKFGGGVWGCSPDDNGLALTCPQGQVPRWSGSSWACALDVDANTLGALNCQTGETARWNGTAWQCSADAVSPPGADTLASLACVAGQVARFNGATWVCSAEPTVVPTTCAAGEVPRWSGTGWACAPDQDANTLTALSCATGDTVRWNGTAWVCAADANALTVNCTNGQVPAWSGTGWGCGVDADTDTLAALSCGNGQLARWNGSGWVCAGDANGLTISCSNGDVPRWNGSGWTCGPDADTNTLGALSCASGETAKWNGTSWACSGDNNALTVTCTNGQVPKWSGTGWACGADTDTNTLGGLGCGNGQIARWNGVAWACALDDNALSFTCVNGQVPKWSGMGWSCAADVDGDTLAALSCGNGQLARWTGAAWACGVDANALSITCSNGQVPVWNGAGWTCGADANTDTLAALGCAAGQVAKWNGTSWACGTDVTTALPTCTNGQIPRWNGSAWACSADADAITGLGCTDGEVPKVVGGVFSCEPDVNALSALNCTNGQIPKRVGGVWACAADNTGSTPVFARVIIVSPGATPLASGTALRNALNGISVTPALVLVEPGDYDLGAFGVAIPENVTLEGSGRDATTIRSVGATLTTSGNVEIRHVRVVSGTLGLTDDGFASARFTVRAVAVEVSGTVGVKSGITWNTAVADLEDVDISLVGAATVSSCDGVRAYNTPDVSLRRVRVSLQGCRHSTGIRANGSGTVRVWNMRQVDVDALGGVDQTLGINISNFDRITLEKVSVRTESVQITAAEANDNGIAVGGSSASVVLADVRANVSSVRGGAGINVSGQLVARDLDIVTNGTGALGVLGLLVGYQSLVDGARITQSGNTSYGLTTGVGGGYARFSRINIQQAGGIGIYNGILPTSVTFHNGSIRGSSTAVVFNGGVTEVFSSILEGTVPAAGASFRCTSTFSGSFARLPSCTY